MDLSPAADEPWFGVQDAVDHAVESMGLRVVKTPVRMPQATAFCDPAQMMSNRRQSA